MDKSKENANHASDRKENEELSEMIKKKLDEASADFAKKVKEERVIRNDIKSVENKIISSLDKESEAFQKRVDDKFSSAKLDSLNEELERATAEGDLDEIARILKLLEG